MLYFWVFFAFPHTKLTHEFVSELDMWDSCLFSFVSEALHIYVLHVLLFAQSSLFTLITVFAVIPIFLLWLVDCLIWGLVKTSGAVLLAFAFLLMVCCSKRKGMCEIRKNNKSERDERNEKKARETKRKSIEDEDPRKCEDRRYHGPRRYSSYIPTWDAPNTRTPAEPVVMGCGNLPSQFHLRIPVGKSVRWRW